ncbi:uncharacterized protein K460DRAFT_274629 [Cucurbitaria berberidis CBS 394.84]|uniref:Uncharacterized protein n=1 Tax=Cucurbitaria berberidis CBS 394.84 TaxID=1168544 RepID=A0A9P4LED3_9PLEO|nr:uncharacterized protein K460DRAFT_274629 [Cucurbitaria berberidis CBS 394.84]KAF1851257.1 hypothetical protein K460DRAFT_274629 [Cucurbitaria berberidis CBS 394.84]
MANHGDSYSTISPIKRTQPTSDETPPWTGMSFIQPVDSDALHEHLKRTYPKCTTLRERKHMAAIDFLETELRQMQSKNVTITATEHCVDYTGIASPRASSEAFGGHSRKGSTSLSQSPASSAHLSTTLERALQDRYSRTSSARLLPKEPSTVEHGQHIVFSAFDGRMMKPKTKRRMTTEEKSAAYKKTRKRGACPKCKRQKGKV